MLITKAQSDEMGTVIVGEMLEKTAIARVLATVFMDTAQ